MSATKKIVLSFLPLALAFAGVGTTATSAKAFGGLPHLAVMAGAANTTSIKGMPHATVYGKDAALDRLNRYATAIMETRALAQTNNDMGQYQPRLSDATITCFVLFKDADIARSMLIPMDIQPASNASQNTTGVAPIVAQEALTTLRTAKDEIVNEGNVMVCAPTKEYAKAYKAAQAPSVGSTLLAAVKRMFTTHNTHK